MITLKSIFAFFSLKIKANNEHLSIVSIDQLEPTCDNIAKKHSFWSLSSPMFQSYTIFCYWITSKSLKNQQFKMLGQSKFGSNINNFSKIIHLCPSYSLWFQINIIILHLLDLIRNYLHRLSSINASLDIWFDNLIKTTKIWTQIYVYAKK